MTQVRPDIRLTQPEDYSLCEAEPVVVVDRPEWWWSYCVLPQGQKPRWVSQQRGIEYWEDWDFDHCGDPECEWCN